MNAARNKVFLATASVLVGMLAGVLYYSPSYAEDSDRPASKKEEKPMPAVAARPRAIPPIDAAAPAKTETATFALG